MYNHTQSVDNAVFAPNALFTFMSTNMDVTYWLRPYVQYTLNIVFCLRLLFKFDFNFEKICRMDWSSFGP